MAEVFDHVGSLHRMGNDETLFAEMVTYLQTDAPARMATAKEGIEQENFTRAHHALHSLKGIVSNFGAARAVAATARLEELLKRQEMGAVATAWDELEAAIDELLSALAPFATNSPGNE